jgi:hypothetical protein
MAQNSVKGGSGLVLVFDLDGTIAKYPEDNEAIIINPAIIRILARAIELKKTGRVDAILLLTNNSDEDYIRNVESVIGTYVHKGMSILNIPKIFETSFKFDDIMSRKDPRRIDKISDDPAKYLEDVETMLKGLSVAIENLGDRVYFFDDLRHEISEQIADGHHILITPPYDPNKEDGTDYSKITDALKDRPTGGGRRGRGRGRGRSRKGPGGKSRKNSTRKRITKRKGSKK